MMEGVVVVGVTLLDIEWVFDTKTFEDYRAFSLQKTPTSSFTREKCSKSVPKAINQQEERKLMRP